MEMNGEVEKVYVTAAFSLGMLPKGDNVYMGVYPLGQDIEYFRRILRTLRSAGIPIEYRIGHASTAAVVSRLLGERIEASREPIALPEDDISIMYVFQILQRPREGQVYSEQEIIEQGNFMIYELKVVPMAFLLNEMERYKDIYKVNYPEEILGNFL